MQKNTESQPTERQSFCFDWNYVLATVGYYATPRNIPIIGSFFTSPNRAQIEANTAMIKALTEHNATVRAHNQDLRDMQEAIFQYRLNLEAATNEYHHKFKKLKAQVIQGDSEYIVTHSEQRSPVLDHRYEHLIEMFNQYPPMPNFNDSKLIANDVMQLLQSRIEHHNKVKIAVAEFIQDKQTALRFK